MDQQVKIRGFRIELGEIENHLLVIEEIKEAVVLAREDRPGDKYLCAYIVSQGKLEQSILQDHLSGNLPTYMIPSYFVRVEHIPLTPNGKIDKKALSQIAVDKEQLTISNEYVPPGDEIEKELVRIWQEVLGLEKIGINDSFIDLGGHSLKAVQVISRIYKKMGVDIGVNRFFQNPTIKKLALEIKNLQWFSKDEDHNEPGTEEQGEMEIIL
jgi:acyl carrier protein